MSGVARAPLYAGADAVAGAPLERRSDGDLGLRVEDAAPHRDRGGPGDEVAADAPRQGAHAGVEEHRAVQPAADADEQEADEAAPGLRAADALRGARVLGEADER